MNEAAIGPLAKSEIIIIKLLLNVKPCDILNEGQDVVEGI